MARISRGGKRGGVALRLLAAVLCWCVLCTSTVCAAGLSDPAEVRGKLQHHGVGSEVRVTRGDGTTLRGRIDRIGQDDFVLDLGRKRGPTTISLSDVSKVRGPGLSHGAKVGIIAGVCLVVAAGIIALVFDHEFKTGFPKTIPI